MRRLLMVSLLVTCSVVAACGSKSAAHGDAGRDGKTVDAVPPDAPGTCASGVLCLDLLAGNLGSAGAANGQGSAALFDNPAGIVLDSAGNVYVADYNNSTIRKIDTTGFVTTLAGSAGTMGSANGTGSAALFARPVGIAIDTTGNLYVGDSANDTIRKVTAAGVVTTFAGSAGSAGSADGTGAAAQFHVPSGVATDSAGNLYVADTFNETIRKITPAGMVTTFAGTAGSAGSANGTGAVARFDAPQGVAVDSSGNIYVADTGNATVRKITPAGAVTTLAGTAGVMGSSDGTGSAAQFDLPIGVAVDTTGNVYVADSLNAGIRKITAAGVVTTVAGKLHSQAIELGATPQFLAPQYLAISGTTLVISDRSVVLLLENAVP